MKSIVHRRLRFGSHGQDVADLQRVVGVKTDGKYGQKTRAAVRAKLDELGGDLRWFGIVGANLTMQRVLRGELPRPASWVKRAKKREAAVPLRERAYKEAVKKIGVMEHGSNNRGAQVEEIIRYAGGIVPEPWCVDFDIWCYGHAGSQVVKPGYPRAVRLMKVAGTTAVTNPQRGDLVRHTFDHTGIFEKDNGNGTITTIEGNTGASGAVSDSTTGGDGVYRKVRAKSLVSDYLRVTR